MALMQRPGLGTGPADNDIYTVLLIVATIFIVIATVVLAYQFASWYGLENLFSGPAVIEK